MKNMMFALVTTALSISMPSTAIGQVVSPTGDSVPAAQAEDVSSVDGIVAALYDVISGPAGEKRNWDRFRSLFIPEGKLIATRFAQGSDRAGARLRPKGEAAPGGPRGVSEDDPPKGSVHPGCTGRAPIPTHLGE